MAKNIDMIIHQNDELTKKIDIIEQTKATSKKSIKINESKMDASTSCIDLIDESSSPFCNEICIEGVVVETCDDLIAHENDELKQGVEKLSKDLTKLRKFVMSARKNLLKITLLLMPSRRPQVL